MSRGPHSARALVGALLGLAAACGPAPAPLADARGVNVLLIVVDTLGNKHLAARSGGPSFTPGIDALAAGGRRFQRALTTAPWTQPAVASLFTSRMPSRHGVQNLMDSLPDAASTLAERFAAAGYSTGAVISHFLIDAKHGFHQGFETFDTSAITEAEGLSAKRVTTRAVRFLEEQRGPFFLFVHYFDPHSLYNHHPEFDQTAGYRGPMRPAMGVWEVRDQRNRLTPADIDYLVGLYHEEIAYTDHHVGRLLRKLEELHLHERTLVVFTADHGEEFMEHGWIGHTRTLFDELIEVPLIFRLPGVIEAGVVDVAVSTLDVAPTLLALVLDEHDPEAEGVALVETLLSKVPPPERDVYAEVSYDSTVGDPEHAVQKRAFRTALVSGHLKLVHDLEADAWQLFDRDRDPAEQRDLWGADPELDQRLRSRLVEWEREHSTTAMEGPEEAIDAERLEELRQLGYVR